MVGKSTIQAVVDCIEHQQAIFQILKMSKNMMKWHVDQRHRQRSFEEGKTVLEPNEIIIKKDQTTIKSSY